MQPSHDCTHSLVFSRQQSKKDSCRLDYKLLSYDFSRNLYVDLFDKNRYTDEYWLQQAILMADNGLISQKFVVKDCMVTESPPLDVEPLQENKKLTIGQKFTNMLSRSKSPTG
jgi:hypothetical protein